MVEFYFEVIKLFEYFISIAIDPIFMKFIYLKTHRDSKGLQQIFTSISNIFLDPFSKTGLSMIAKTN